MGKDQPGQSLARFLEDNVLGWRAVLTVKSQNGPSVNVFGPFSLWTIHRFDKQPPIDETVLSRPADTADTNAGDEPPFHVHINTWSSVVAARLDEHGSEFLRPRFPKALQLLNERGDVMLWWYIDSDHARHLEELIGFRRTHTFE
jgi:hypothetical protein